MVQKNKTAKKVRFSKKLHKTSKHLKKTSRYKKNSRQHKKRSLVKHHKKNHKKTMKKRVKSRKATPYMRGGHSELLAEGPITFYPKNFLNSIPHYPQSGDMHAPNGLIQSSTSIPIQNAGGLIPSDIVNLGRNVMYGAQNIYSNFMGDTLPASANPNILHQPAMKTTPTMNIQPIDIDKIYTDTDANVAVDTMSQLPPAYQSSDSQPISV